jgi:hypothetical protein
MVRRWAAKGVPQFIVSDANSLFITEALRAHGMLQHFPPHHIYTNPAEYVPRVTDVTDVTAEARAEARAPHPVLPGAFCCTMLAQSSHHAIVAAEDAPLSPLFPRAEAARAPRPAVSGSEDGSGYFMWFHHYNSFTQDISPVNMCKVRPHTLPHIR